MLDENGKRVVAFESALRNASRLGTYVDTVLGMFASGAWRHYKTAVGEERWRAHEFDYFLISCDASYADVARLLAWDTAKAANMAGAMEGDDLRQRRPLDQASRDWASPTGKTLVDLAGHNGWLKSAANGAAAPKLKRAPVPPRALVRARQGITMDEHARRERARQLKDRRAELDRLVERIVTLAQDEPGLRYVRDQLARRLAHGRERSRPSPPQAATR